MSLNYPETPRKPVTKTIGGITFEDPYAWLQEETPEVLEWQSKQNLLAKDLVRSWVGYEQLHAAIAKEGGFHLDELLKGVPRLVGGKWFQITTTSDGAGSAVCVSDSYKEPGRVIVDTLTLAENRKDDRPVMLYYYEPSPDGSQVALMVASGGDEVGSIHVVDTESGEMLPIDVPFPVNNGPIWDWVQDASGILAGGRAKDGRHLIRFIPVAKETHPHSDIVFGFDQVHSSIPILTPQISPGGRWAVAVSGPHEHTAFMIGNLNSGDWRPFLPADFKGECHGEWADDEHFIAIETGTAPRGRVVSIPVSTSTDLTTWQELVPTSEAVLRSLTVLQGNILLADLLDVSMRLRRLALDGTFKDEIPLPPFGSSPLVFIFREFPRSDACLFQHGTFTQQTLTYHLDLDTGELEVVGEPTDRLEGIEVSQCFATSKDGTRVPYFIVHHVDVDISSPQPTLLTGYGGFNQAWMPTYLAHLLHFVRAGGVFAHACLRGGGEYGKEWHEAGRLHNKQNTFDDLYAVAEDLIAAGTTVPNRLALEGASNGGLLAGVAIVQRPDLWKAVVPTVPILDMMTPASEADVRAYTEADYGNPNDPDDAAVMYSYSPYHNIRDGVAYPGVFQVFGEKDTGCPPFQGRKFTARLQEANTGDNPILMRVWSDAGHGTYGAIGAQQNAEWLSFVMRELGMNI
ncbi:MAG: prolyl oligopeptidase family serine peptidase [Anaerolineales bacterium]